MSVNRDRENRPIDVPEPLEVRQTENHIEIHAGDGTAWISAERWVDLRRVR